MAPAVSLRGITKRFGDVVANDGVSLDVERGTVHALLGENGAGKTTLMNVLYGLYRPDAGEIRVDGDPVTFDSPRDAIARNIGMIHQHFVLVETMTVAENVTLGREPTKWRGLAKDRERMRTEVADLAAEFDFDVDPAARIEDVGVGVRQRVEILKAIYRGADVLILDEPTAVLTPQEVDRLFEVFESLTAEGKTIIFITHKLREVLTAADRITVLRDGCVVGEVDAADATRERLGEMLVGREVSFDRDRPPAPTGDPMLEVSDLSVFNENDIRRVSGVDFAVREGEIFGVVGVDGNGQSELVDAVVGTADSVDGTVRFDGTDVTDRSRRERQAMGLGYIPEDRQEQGLIMDFTLTENAILGRQHAPRFTSRGHVDWTEARETATRIVEAYDVRPPNPERTARSLSGGNQQKFVVGRELLSDPDLVVAANPTRGVDIGSIEFIHDRLLDLRSEGKAILLVSSKLDEVQQLADRAAVMYDGSFMDVVDPARTTEEEFGLLMGGEPLGADGTADTRDDPDPGSGMGTGVTPT